MILIGTDEGIYRWFEGSGWPIFHSLQDRPVIALGSSGPGVLVALERSGTVWESTNNGLDWRTIPLPAGSERATNLCVAGGKAPGIVLGVKPLGLYRRAIGAPVPQSAEPDPRLPGWRVMARDLAESATALLAPKRTVVKADAATVRLAGWASVTAPGVPKTTTPAEFRSLTPVGADGSVWLAAVNGAGLWRSEDQGKGWTQVSGLPSEVYAVRTTGKPGELWAATSDGAWFSSDDGKTWADQSAGLENARQVRAIAVHPADPKTLFAGAAPVSTGTAAPTDGLGYALYESADAGKTWTKSVKRNFPESLEYDTIADIQFDPAAPDNVVVALGSGELWVTRNGGAYWGPLARQIRAARALCALG